MLPWVCSVIDHRRRQNVVRTWVTHSAIASCATFLFLPHFDVICDLLLNRRTATWNLFVNCMGIPIKSWRRESYGKKKSQLKSLTLLPLWVASFLCGYFPDPTRFEPFFNFWVVDGYNKTSRLETKFSGATNLSQMILDKISPRSQFHIRINWKILNFHLNPPSTQ